MYVDKSIEQNRQFNICMMNNIEFHRYNALWSQCDATSIVHMIPCCVVDATLERARYEPSIGDTKSKNQTTQMTHRSHQ
jgi:hypothetical protein